MTAAVRSSRLRSLVVGAALAVAGCAVNPVSGRPEVTLISSAREQELGAEEARRVAATMGLVDDPALPAYATGIGERLARRAPHHEFSYSFHVVDSEEPNAFALPGGYVYVSRGLLVLLNSEDELAGVLGHEIGHVAARHAVRRVTRAAPLAVVTGIGAALTGIVSPTLGSVVGGMGGLAGALVLAPYSRSQEHEADRLGQDFAAQAGWDPAGISRALHTLEREEALHAGEKRPMAFFATHPPLPRRVEDTAERAATLRRSPGGVTGSDADFLRRLDGLPVGPRPGDGVVDGTEFSHPDLGFTLRFPAGWKVQNARDAVAALAPGGDAMVVLESVGTGNDPAEALRAFEKETKSDLSSRAERLSISGSPAIRVATRARTPDGPLALELTWVAYAEHVYRITGATPPARSATFEPAFRDTVGSFRPLTAAERSEFRETRLRLVAARQGETLAAVLARGGGAWSPEEAAVANGVEPGTTLGRGQLVKVPRAEPYRPR